MKNITIKQKILFGVSGSVAILISLFAMVAVKHIKQVTQEKVETDVMNEVLIKSEEMKGFLKEKAAMVVAMSESEFMLDWFTKNSQRGAPIEELPPGFDLIMQTFKNMKDIDPDVDDAYFASQKTREYFSHNDQRLTISNGQPYNATQRPWYKSTVAKGKMWVSDVSYNELNKKISNAIQNPVKNRQGEFIGISGIDIDLSSLAKMIDSMRYKGVGEGFLINRAGKVNYWPPTDGLTIENAVTSLVDVQGQFEGASGFRELEKNMIANEKGVQYGLMWKGAPYVAIYHAVQLDRPFADFTLALMIPLDILNKPVNDAILVSVVGVITAIVAISIVILLITIPIVKPINEILLAMKDIADGEGDLTKRLVVHSRDEIKELADVFNQFVARIQSLVKRAGGATERVASTLKKSKEIVSETDKNIQKQKIEIEVVATAITEMTSTVDEIARSCQSANQSAVEADRNNAKGAAAVEESIESIAQLVDHIKSVSEVVNLLEKDSQEIGAILEVIENIAAQTNLLALNAAIEAARAGEQGRGFAVVADEVRTLANKTQESTENIYRMIETLQGRTKKGVQVMTEGTATASNNSQKIEAVASELSNITSSVDETKQMSLHIATATEEQSVVTSEVGRNIINISELADESAEGSIRLLKEVSELEDTCSELEETLQHFKV